MSKKQFFATISLVGIIGIMIIDHYHIFGLIACAVGGAAFGISIGMDSEISETTTVKYYNFDTGEAMTKNEVTKHIPKIHDSVKMDDGKMWFVVNRKGWTNHHWDIWVIPRYWEIK